MTVEELIDQLHQCDPELEVYIPTESGIFESVEDVEMVLMKSGQIVDTDYDPNVEYNEEEDQYGEPNAVVIWNLT